MGIFVKHTNCPQCNSKDNLAVYSDGSCHCFGCGYTIASEEYSQEHSRKKHKVKHFNMTVNNLEIKTNSKPAISSEEAAQIKSETISSGNGFRGIRDETYSYFGVRHRYNDEDEVVEQYYPVTQDGQLSGYKIREIPKTFYSKGRTGSDCDLFGQFRFNRGGKYLILTEGECLLPDTKVLTKNWGWVTLRKYNPHVDGQVMQGDGTWALPLAVIMKDYSGDMIRFKHHNRSLDVTPGHNMVYYDDTQGTFEKIPATEMQTRKHKVPLNVNIKTTEKLRPEVALGFMLMGGNFNETEEGNYIVGSTGNLYRQHAIVDTLKRAKIPFEVKNSNKKNSSAKLIIIKSDKKIRIPENFNWKLHIDYAPYIIHYLNAIRLTRTNTLYTAMNIADAEFVRTCAAIIGVNTKIVERHGGLMGRVNYIVAYDSRDDFLHFTDKDTYKYEGKVGCLQMPAGSLFVKQGDHMFVTGNCDALSAYQIMKDYSKSKGGDYETAVVSPTTGANSKKQIAAQYRFFDSFEQIILSYDNDKAGKEAVEEIVKVLPKGKVKIMQMRHKDANDYLTANAERQFIIDFYDAKRYTPVGVLGSGDLYDKIIEQAYVPKVPFPPFMRKLNDMLVGGLPLGYICNIAAKTGIGKTSLINEMIYHWVFHSPHKIGIVSMELDAGQYGETLLGRHLSRKLSLIKDEQHKQNLLLSENTKQKANELFYTPEGQHRFYLLDNRDGSVEEIQDTIEELVVSCGCKIVVLDPLQDILDGLDNEEQAVFLKWCKGIIKSHNVTLILINHVRKTKESEGLSEEAIHGSSTIIKSAAFNIMLDRDKEAEDPVVRNTTTVKITKNRVYGFTGPAGEIFYENETNTLYDKEYYFSTVTDKPST